MVDPEPSFQERRERVRRVQDVRRALEGLKDHELPPLPLLSRLLELGIKDAAMERVSVLRRRLDAIEALYAGRFVDRRTSGRRLDDKNE
jgi:hypothetical protein